MMPNNNPAPTKQKALSVSTFLCRITDISFSSFTLNCRYFSSLLSIMQRYTFSPNIQSLHQSTLLIYRKTINYFGKTRNSIYLCISFNNK